MSSTSTVLILGAGAFGLWWLFGGRKDYFVQGSRSHEYFSDLGEAQDYRASHAGSVLYEIPKGSEFHDSTAKRLTPNRARRKRKRRR